MSNYGMLVLNKDDKTQVESTAPLLKFSHKIEGASNGSRKQVSERYPVAFCPAEGFSLNMFGGYYGVLEIWDNGQRATTARTEGTGDIIIFTIGDINSDINYGLNVYNDDGTLTFSSKEKPINVLDVVNIPDIRTTATNINGIPTYWRKQYPGKTIAAMLFEYPVFQKGNSFLTASPSLRNGYFALEEALMYSAEGGTLLFSTWHVRAMIIDITGY